MEVDINGDGTIGIRLYLNTHRYLNIVPNDINISDFDEFLGMMKNKASEADQESDLRDAFKIFDRDNNGYIDM